MRRYTDEELAGRTFTKGELDSFGHKIRHVVPEDVKAMWTNEFAKLKRTDLKRKEFVEECLAVGKTIGAWSSPYFTHLMTISKTDTSGTGGGMITFTQLIEKEGAENAQLIAQHKRLHMEPNPKTFGLPGVIWPHDQLFAYDQKVWSSTTSNTESLTSKSTSEGNAAAVAAMHDAMGVMQRTPDVATYVPMVTNPVTVAAAESAAVAEHKQLCVGTIAALKKNHGEWDRTKLNWNGQITRAAANKNAKNTQVVHDLHELVSGGEAIDSVLTGHLNTWISSGNLDAEVITQIKSKFDALAKLIKSGQKLVAAVGVLLKL